MEPGHDQLGLPTGWNHPNLDPIAVAQHQQQWHPPSPTHVRSRAVQAGVIDVCLLKPGPGNLALGVLARLMQGLNLIDKT